MCVCVCVCVGWGEGGEEGESVWESVWEEGGVCGEEGGECVCGGEGRKVCVCVVQENSKA